MVGDALRDWCVLGFDPLGFLFFLLVNLTGKSYTFLKYFSKFAND